MKKHYLLFIFLLFVFQLNGQTIIEAETGILSGPNIHIATSQTGYSGTGYLDGFNSATDQVTVTFNAPVASSYQIEVGYSTPYGAKVGTLLVNGIVMGDFALPQTNNFDIITVASPILQAGNNTITIRPSWTWFIIDYFKITQSVPHQYNVTATLINPNASAEAVAVYNYLCSNYGQKILAGQTDGASQGLLDITGKSFVIKAFDFGLYSPKCAWGWENGGPAFAPIDNGDIDSLINWYNQTNGCGIPSVQFHWHSPSGGTLQTNTFYTENTTFNITQGVIPGTTEYNEIIRDIDSISAQFKKIEDLNIPVLWRPLHEAGGGWFWWSDGGPSAVAQLWDIMYDRMTNYHGLNNLIWVWSTPEANYYLGNNKLDIFGMDSYPGAYDYSTQKGTFDQMYEICNGEKIIAMTENGPIPDMDACITQDARWSYFVTWDDFYQTENSQAHVLNVYNSLNVTTLDEKCSASTIGTISATKEITVFPNPASDFFLIQDDINETWQLFNSIGVLVLEGKECKVNIQKLNNGLYILRSGQQIIKIIKE